MRQARALALESGDADLAFQLPPESLDRLRGHGIRIDSTWSATRTCCS
jgi:hypothetical protein